MQTSLPDLPFTYARAEINPSGVHSAAKSTPRTYPRTDLTTLIPWTSFPMDIHQAVQSATTDARLSSTPFNIPFVATTSGVFVGNEEKIRAYAIWALHEPVEAVLRRLEVNGSFILPGSGEVGIVGDPDFSWITSGRGTCTHSQTPSHPKLIVEYKTWWAVDLQHVVAAFNGTHMDTLSQQSLHALQQTYGYMSFNNNKFGILTNWQCVLFLRRAETPDRKTLEYYTMELDGQGQPFSMLKAWVGMVLLAEDNWFYASPTTSPSPPDRNFRKYHEQPVNGRYPRLPLDFCLCSFDLSSACRGAMGCVVNAQFLTSTVLQPEIRVVCKVVDAPRYPETAELLDTEASAYAALKNLQGKVIPKLYGFYEVWGILHLLALEPVGNAIPEDEQINQTLRTKMKAALQRIHSAGFVHGDVAHRNFCRRNGRIFLVDLERCRHARDLSELGNELNETPVCISVTHEFRVACTDRYQCVATTQTPEPRFQLHKDWGDFVFSPIEIIPDNNDHTVQALREILMGVYATHDENTNGANLERDDITVLCPFIYHRLENLAYLIRLDAEIAFS
ncbi:hypothetical protein M378DRAFT_7103 [Amanita muscaria Koide BX008]|uniref:Protein kinase domain-containing protein n=1 Tax=Amanita muscaria (strain Koide BX008) TaxID=946122 RepID=A0A0C2X775_AMAMK|nr:hypothetical protein M378DRAFT_7103 [Amanita muscaria Koide BX008]